MLEAVSVVMFGCKSATVTFLKKRVSLWMAMQNICLAANALVRYHRYCISNCLLFWCQHWRLQPAFSSWKVFLFLGYSSSTLCHSGVCFQLVKCIVYSVRRKKKTFNIGERAVASMIVKWCSRNSYYCLSFSTVVYFWVWKKMKDS